MDNYSCSFQDVLEKVSRGLMVRTDSRLVRPGDVFVAIPGTATDGANFIQEAAAAGARYIVSSTPNNTVRGQGVHIIVHPDTPTALGELAKAYFKTDHHRLKIIGITGTNGKSTSTFILEHLLAETGLKIGMLGTVLYRWPGFTLNSTMTTPDCWTLHELIANMAKSDVDVVVMEVSSHAIHQKRIAGLSFDIAVLTNITQDHLDYHETMEQYRQTKATLFRSFPFENKLNIFNYDDLDGRKLLEELPEATGYGLSTPPANIPCISGIISNESTQGFTLTTCKDGKQWEINTHLIGRHNAFNLLAAQAAGLALGLSEKDFKKLEQFKGIPGRLERVPNQQGLNIFIDYAHTPDALLNIQKALRPLTKGRLITLFGCGGDRDSSKRPLMAKAVAQYADVAILTSDNPRSEDPLQIMAEASVGLTGCKQIFEEVDRAEAIALAVGMMCQDDILLVTGKGHESYQQIGANRFHFNDMQETKKAVEALGSCSAYGK